MNSRLYVELDPNRKIKDIKSSYMIKINAYDSLEDEFGRYAYKFYSAAHYISSYLLESEDANIGELDTWFFSLAFLYRHSIELLLKGIAFQSIISKEERIDFAKDTFHDLYKILDKILLVRDTNRSEEEIEWLCSYFKDISNIDRKSDSFRYPFHIKRTRDYFTDSAYFSIERIFEKKLNIDLVAFVNKFKAAYEILSLWYNNEFRHAEEWKCLTPVLLEEGGSYYNQSVIGFGYSRQDFYPYVSGYIEAAGLLRIKLLESADSMIADVYFLPMCYLYRNAIELVIKSAWFEGVRDNFQKRCKTLYNCKHSIVGLWKRLQEWITGYYNEDDDTVIYFDKILKCCEELQSFDCDASRFRYPCTKHMELYNKRNFFLDYLNVAEFMESLFNSIDGVGCELSARNDYLNEMEVEYRSDVSGYMS